MEETEFRPGRAKRITYVLVLVISIAVTVGLFYYARIKRLEAEDWHQRAMIQHEESMKLQGELDSCKKQSALARARADAALAEVQRLRNK
jgi:hypothetical protein